ncbi:MAG: oxidoreductase family protein [Xanthobacteraceae bacterium]|nr:oxidoreductase family protein [Xanthobacteraceae bacterium]
MINAAIIGLGRWGKSLVSAVQGSERLRFVHGVSQEPDEARDFTTKHGLRLSTDLRDVLADPQVQAVFLATPHSLHVEQVQAVAANGRAVWCEKPLALTRTEAARAVEACRKAGVVLASGNNKRCFASMRELKRVVASGEIGEVMHIEGHFSNEHSTRVSGGWRDDPRESPGAGMTGAGLHILDALINLGGPLTQVHTQLHTAKAPPDPRDVVAMLGKFANGASGMLTTVRATPMYWRFAVFGTNGYAEARDEDTLTVAKIGGEPVTQTYPHADSLRVLAESFADAIEGRAPFLVSTDQMLDLIGAFEAVIRSMDTGAPVAVPRA